MFHRNTVYPILVLFLACYVEALLPPVDNHISSLKQSFGQCSKENGNRNCDSPVSDLPSLRVDFVSLTAAMMVCSIPLEVTGENHMVNDALFNSLGLAANINTNEIPQWKRLPEVKPVDGVFKVGKVVIQDFDPIKRLSEASYKVGVPEYGKFSVPIKPIAPTRWENRPSISIPKKAEEMMTILQATKRNLQDTLSFRFNSDYMIPLDTEKLRTITPFLKDSVPPLFALSLLMSLPILAIALNKAASNMQYVATFDNNRLDEKSELNALRSELNAALITIKQLNNEKLELIEKIEKLENVNGMRVKEEDLSLLDEESLKQKTVPQLKAFLKSKNLPQSGRKDELIQSILGKN